MLPDSLTRQPALATMLAVAACVALSAGPAGAAPTLEAPDCVGSDPPAKTLHVEGGGFVPGEYVQLIYEADYLEEPRSAALLTADAAGAFSTDLVPPTLLGMWVNRREFTLRASDPLRPELDVAKEMAVERVRLRVSRRTARSASERVSYRAVGFTPGRIVYAHFQTTNGGARRTVELGRARGACGRVSRRMNIVPGRNVPRGSWYVNADQRRRYSPRTQPQEGIQVIIQRPR